MKTRYCLGFIFDETRDLNLMIEKNRPEWQAGLLNGIGGKVENGELSSLAMARECEEETGLIIPENKWSHGGNLLGIGWSCNVYYTTYHDIFEARTMESERVLQLSTRELILGRMVTVSHAPALVHLCKMQKDGLNNMRFVLNYSEADRADEKG